MVHKIIDPESEGNSFGEITSEQLTKELIIQAEVAKEILSTQSTERTKKMLTNPSSMALSTTEKDAGQGVNSVKKTVKQLFTLYLTNQFVARAINVRADTLISKGYEIIGEDNTGIEACSKLIEDSGGINLFWQISVNTDIAGDGFLEKIPNIKGNKIVKLKHVHPITLTFKRNKQSGRIVVDDDGEPVGYVQHFEDKNGKEEEKDIDKEKIEHLRFNTLGDEFTGISTIQPAYNTIVRLMNMEFSAAEAAVKTANPLIVAKANTKSPHQIAMWGQILGRISGQDQIFVPEGMEIKFLSPGTQNFSDYSEYFLNAIVAGFGVPKGVLLGASDGDGNRAEGQILTRHFYSMIRSNQRYMQDFFNKIFREYAEMAGFRAPKLIFPDVAEDASLVADAAIKLFESGLIDREEAREMIGLDISSTKREHTQGTSADLKKQQRATQFPAKPGKAEGSQKGIKASQKRDPMSEVKPNS